ncbi:MAG: hypothetical protein P8X60_06855 [Robiginitalea sp.]
MLAGLLGMQAQEEEGIPWEAGQPLDWSDFRGTPPDSKRVAATTVIPKGHGIIQSSVIRWC